MFISVQNGSKFKINFFLTEVLKKKLTLKSSGYMLNQPSVLRSFNLPFLIQLIILSEFVMRIIF